MSQNHKKSSTVRHTRAIARDREKRPTTAPPDPVIEHRLTELIHPALFSQMAQFQALGLRHRVLSLPVMVAFLVSLLWRHIGSVREAVRVLHHEGLLWTAPTEVSQQAISQRLRTLPAALFERLFTEILPLMQTRSHARSRAHDPVVGRAHRSFTSVLALDGSTLDALVKKTGLLRHPGKAPLGGRMMALFDLGTGLPHQVLFDPDAQAHDGRFWPWVLEQVAAQTLLVFDLGFINYTVFDHLSNRSIGFVTRLKKGGVFQVEALLSQGAGFRDQVVTLGGASHRCRHPMRIVEVCDRGRWYHYVTNVLDPAVLSAPDVVLLYQRRWRIEDAFKLAKRLLGLAYFYSGAQNAVELQVWTTWLLYAVLVDLSDDLAEQVRLPLHRISLEMVFRGLYHFTQAYHRGQAQDPVRYLAEHAQSLSLIKRKRPRDKPSHETPLQCLLKP
jgi:hypothetical protein